MKTQIHETITARIIAELETGVTPWSKPWVNGKHDIQRPLRSVDLPYSGVNVINLWLSSIDRGYGNSYWFTFNQAAELNAFVRKGEKGTAVIYAGRRTVETDKADADDAGDTVAKSIPFLRTYTVFNAEQIDGLPEKFMLPVERIAHPDFFINTKAVIKSGGNQAYYAPSSDYIKMPVGSQFVNEGAYFATLAHELIHWTGHPSRLNREKGKVQGDDAYAFEELVAELGATFLCADLGYTPGHATDNHAAYIGHWLKIMRADSRAIIRAASQASKAVEFLHSLQPQPAAVS
jgi:antirestriction protein ArdC